MWKVAAPEILDELWYHRLERVLFEDYEKLSGTKDKRAAQKELFLKGKVHVPELDYPELQNFDFDHHERALTYLRQDVLEIEKNVTVKKLYRAKVDELLATVRMLRATKNQDDIRFSHYVNFIYGRPKWSDINYVFTHVQDLIKNHEHDDNDEKRAAARSLRPIFERLETTADYEPTIDKSILPEGEPIEGLVADIEEVVAACRDALSELYIDDWAVVVDTEKGLSNFSVSQEHKIIRVPAPEKLRDRSLSKKKLRALLAHEIGTHVLRRHNGENSRLKLLGLGLDRYLSAEEGIATYREQTINGAKEFAGVPRFLSIIIAKGVDGRPRDFRSTFEIMREYRVLSSPPLPDAKEKAAATAYNDCVRIFRGTTCRTPGAVFTKDMAYFANRDIWNLLANEPAAAENFNIGKYDPTNSKHVAGLLQLGILKGV